MAATQTVPQYSHDRNFRAITPRHGVVTLFGYGIRAQVERGHLILEDGIGPERRKVRLPRVGHGLRRLVVIGADGMVSLAALRWLADQDAAFVMLERNGKVLATTGPVRPSDARLRRAQSLAHQSGVALNITRELISQKLVGQERVVNKYFRDESATKVIARAHDELPRAKSSEQIRLLEAQAALAYWTAWRDLLITFPRIDLPRVPDHWRKFGSRLSPLTRSPRLAVNPANAMLNYLYAVLESEARLSLAELGLDPGLGVMHYDTRNRDSLASDLMEPIRPQVDAFLLDWLRKGPVRREWFFEQSDGNCRLMGSFAIQLSETSQMWRRALAPFAEGISHSLWTNLSKRGNAKAPATRLTQNHKREAKGVSFDVVSRRTLLPPSVCRICGVGIKTGFKYCLPCLPTISRENVAKAAKLGRMNTHTATAQARRSNTKKRQDAALKSWNPADKPDWLDEKFYREHIQPRLAQVQVPKIQAAISVSEPYALRIRGAQCVPHPRHWMTLAQLAGVSNLDNIE
jgi:CRISPR-associated endonuclease Cas1